jgi:hypothetical protein
MIDRIFFAAFSFCLLVVATLVLASSLFGIEPSAAAQARAVPAASMVRMVQLPPVEIVGRRLASDATLARTEAEAPAAQRLQ